MGEQMANTLAFVGGLIVLTGIAFLLGSGLHTRAIDQRYRRLAQRVRTLHELERVMSYVRVDESPTGYEESVDKSFDTVVAPDGRRLPVLSPSKARLLEAMPIGIALDVHQVASAVSMPLTNAKMILEQLGSVGLVEPVERHGDSERRYRKIVSTKAVGSTS